LFRVIVQLLQDATEARSKAVNSDGEVRLQEFAEHLAACGYPVWLRTGRTEKCCSNQVSLRHTFVVAAVEGGQKYALPMIFAQPFTPF
jgi:hypothetical protein